MLPLLLAILTVILTLYFITCRKFGYWKNKNVPHLKPIPLFGNFADLFLFKTDISILEQQICLKFGNEPLVGAYLGTEPVLIVQDLELIKLVTTKDFYYFNSREMSDYVHKEGLLKNLFDTYGDEWKVLRQNLTPLFSSAKMKNMFYLIESCAKTFEKSLDEDIKASAAQEARSVIGRFTMDCIGSCAFGLDMKAMDSDERQSNPFTNIRKLIFDISSVRALKTWARMMWPGIFYGLGQTVVPKELEEFFTKLMIGVFHERTSRLKTSQRNDFVDMVLSFNQNKCITGDSMKNLKSGASEKIKLDVDNNLLVAQCFIFFAAGFETSATTSSFALYELAKHPEAQRRAREEVDEYLRKHKGILGYECVTELPYLELCIEETLRLYPVLGVLTREAVENYTFPGTKVTIEKGMRIHLPVFHLQHDPKYFPDPEAFKPERFSPQERKNIISCTYFPFGEGPRTCIGMRFAKMQMLAGLVTILKKYQVELCDDMPRAIVHEPRSLVTQSKDGIKLKFTCRSDREPITFSSAN